MNRRSFRDFHTKRAQLQSAEAELSELQEQIRAFETLVDDRLGSLLDQLSELREQTHKLDEELRNIRERRLFGEGMIEYLEGAPKPARPLNLTDLPLVDISGRGGIQKPMENASSSQEQPLPDIRVIYRKLARRYHPDLARSDSDRQASNEHMTEINRAYTAGDLPTLMRLAGMSIPFAMDMNMHSRQASASSKHKVTEQEEVEQKLIDVRQEIARLSALPIVKLSLDAKLARHQRRDLLGEIALELQYKLARKLAERDYLQSQINASLG